MIKVKVIQRSPASIKVEPQTGIAVKAYQAGPPGLNAAQRVYNETPAGLVNGSNATFTSAFDFIPGTEEVYVNGIRLKILEDYNTTGTTTITLFDSPQTGENILINYTKQ